MIYTKQNFRKLKLVSLILLIGLISSRLKGQSVSTIGEIYDYEINDVFHTHEYYLTQNSGFALYSNIQISDKYFSADGDTLFYIRNVNTHYGSSNQPDITYDFFVDTISFTNVDSPINDGNIDSVYSSNNYNGRKVNFRESELINGWEIIDKYIEGCGGSYYNAFYMNPDNGVTTNHYLRLLYFKKGSEEWGTPNTTSVENLNSKQYFKVYPNPASDKLNLDLADLNNSTCSGIIYSITGKRIEQFSLSSVEKKQLDVSTLNKGLYIIQLNIDGNHYSSTFVKN